MRSICVFCGSSLGNELTFVDAAKNLGELLAEKKTTLVYGGANVGLMGTVANACLENNGKVIGVMPRNLVEMEVAHDGLTDLKIVETMHERKALMSELSDGFISLPEGIGTIEETFEMFTWMQLGIHLKPVSLLNIKGFFDGLRHFLETMVKQGFLLKQHLDMLIIEPDIHSLINRLETYEPEIVEKWFDKEKNRAI